MNLTEDELTICLMIGVTPKDFAETKCRLAGNTSGEAQARQKEIVCFGIDLHPETFLKG